MNTEKLLNQVDTIILESDFKSAIEFFLNSLQEFISCERISLLLWDEDKQKLMMRYSTEFPEKLEPEEYDYDEVLTGKFVFADGNCFRGLIDFENRSIYNEITKSYIIDSPINWTDILAFKKKSKFRNFKSLMIIPFTVNRQWRGVLRFTNKINNNGDLDNEGFTNEDQKFFLTSIRQRLEHLVSVQMNDTLIKNILSLQELASKKTPLQTLLKTVVCLCSESLNFKICCIRFFKNGRFTQTVSNKSHFDLNEMGNEEQLFSEKPDGVNFRYPIFWSKTGVDVNPYQIYENNSHQLSSFPKNVLKFIEDNDLQSYISIPISSHDDFFGILECGTKLPLGSSKGDMNLVVSFARALALGIENIDKSEYLEKVANLIGRLGNQENIEEIYKTILDCIVNDLEFDYAVISRVNHENKIIEIKIGKSAYENLINPNQWNNLANYTFEEKDILVDLTFNPRIEIITGLEGEKKWNNEHNKKIFKDYGLKDLVRAFVPIVFYDSTRKEPLVVSIIEAGYHTSHRTSIPEHKIELLKLFGNFAESIHKALSLADIKSVDRMLQFINAPDFSTDPISSPASIYEEIVSIICKYLHTEAVSIWEKVSIGGGFVLQLAHATEPLKNSYKQFNVRTLPSDSFAFNAVRTPQKVVKSQDYVTVFAETGGIMYINENGIKNEALAYSNVSLEMGYNGMIYIPLQVGKEIYSTIIVFTKNKSLLKGEAEALSILASRAAVVVQSAKIIESFRIISEISPNEDIESALAKIAESSLSVLHADSVVLYRNHNGKLVHSSLASGAFNNKSHVSSPVILRENNLAYRILQHGSCFFDNEEDYLEYVKENNVQRIDRPPDSGFWHREKLKSSAALRLQFKRQYADSTITEIVGIMFINYRTKQNFTTSQKNLIELFGSLAATAIYNAYLLDENIKFWETRRRDSFALSINEVTSGLIHNSGNLLSLIIMEFSRFKHFLKARYENKAFIEKDVIVDYLISKLEGPLDELSEDFQRIGGYRKYQEFNALPQKIIPLINNSIKLLNNKFDRNNIRVNTKSMREDAIVICDSNQIQHLFLNLFINAVDAIGRKGELSLATEISQNRDFLIIGVTDNGRGIPYELRSKVFEIFFTTKRSGSGLGLPISKFIAERHGGHIEFGENRAGKGTSFYIYLPIYTH